MGVAFYCWRLLVLICLKLLRGSDPKLQSSADKSESRLREAIFDWYKQFGKHQTSCHPCFRTGYKAEW